ncbi:MAG: cytochrome P450 [Myxococcales bacterium]
MLPTKASAESKRLAPGPREWPLLGNLGAMRGLLPFLESQWAAHGDAFRIRLAGFRALMVAHPDSIQRVLVANRHNYVKGAAYDGTRRILGESLVTLDGEAWKERRSLAQPAFHRQALEKLAAIMVESGARFFDALDERLGQEGAVVDVHEEMVRLTLDVVISALFGRGTIENSEISYEALGQTLELLSVGANGAQLPPWVPTPRNLRFHRTVRALDANVYKIIETGRAQNAEGTLLSMLLASRDENGQPLSDKALRDEVITLFLAGHETTALTLSWMFVLLEQEREVIARMRSEVDSVLGGREPGFADVPKLAYLRQVIDETLRLRPPAAMVARNAIAEDVLGGFYVGGGECVVPFIWAAHRHPDYWQDPLRFDPERFTAAASKGRHTSSYLPFSGGPRICIGNTFSLVETVLLVAQMFSRFDMEILSCADVKPVAIGTVRPSHPVRVRLSRRRRPLRVA